LLFEGSITGYTLLRRGTLQFCLFRKVCGYEKFLYKGLTDCEQLLKGEPKLIQSNIIEWLIHIKEVQNLSYASISLYCTALHHFYDMNDIAGLNWKKIGSFIAEKIKKGQAIHKRRDT